jgi:23S rRNA (guanosine2251-2'-O)-methyltransferase
VTPPRGGQPGERGARRRRGGPKSPGRPSHRDGGPAAESEGPLWIGGFHAVGAALASGRVSTVALVEGRRDARAAGIETLAGEAGVPVERVPREDLERRELGNHQGVAARVEQPRPVEDEAALEALLDRALAEGRAPLLLILEGVTDPRNLGACLRSADAAGADAVLVPRSRTAPLTAAARKTASGAAETVPLIAVANLARTLRWLGQRGLTVIGLAGEGGAPPWSVDLDGPVALVMGAEGEGLRRLTREHCDALVALPMTGTVESLNVSVAAGIALFEAVRQRAPAAD